MAITKVRLTKFRKNSLVIPSSAIRRIDKKYTNYNLVVGEYYLKAIRSDNRVEIPKALKNKLKLKPNQVIDVRIITKGRTIKRNVVLGKRGYGKKKVVFAPRQKGTSQSIVLKPFTDDFKAIKIIENFIRNSFKIQKRSTSLRFFYVRVMFKAKLRGLDVVEIPTITTKEYNVQFNFHLSTSIRDIVNKIMEMTALLDQSERYDFYYIDSCLYAMRDFK